MKKSYCTQNNGGADRLVPPYPRCGSACVHKKGTDTKPDPHGGTERVPTQRWHCRDCGYHYQTLIDEDQ
jgi:transposase-like protein